VDLPPGPNFFLYADAEKSTESLTAAGFEAVTHTTVPQIWELQSAEDLLESVLHGTVRAAALLRMQPPDVLDRIRDSVRQAVEAYADGGVYRVPMPGVVFSAMRPTTA
jgi:hypothetical protein